MATKSYFILQPAAPPQNFTPRHGSQLLAIQDLWEAARQPAQALIFRVRSESEPDATFSGEDRLESCVGLVDASTRWRSVADMARHPIAAIRHPQLAQACGNALQFLSSQHPANVSPAQRQAIAGELMKIVEGAAAEEPVTLTRFEAMIANHVAALAQADNDVEAAFCVPMVRAFNQYDPEKQRSEYMARQSTVETMSGAVLLSEAANRLSERMPAWHFAEMPKAEAKKVVVGREKALTETLTPTPPPEDDDED